MKLKSFGFILFLLISSTLFSLGKGDKYNFKVVSILGDNYNLGVKHGETVTPLTASPFPLFTGQVENNNIDKYKYVVLDGSGKIVEEETIERTYSSDSSKINEVYNRTNKNVEIPKLPEPFKKMFRMGIEQFQPFPNNIIYNVYAKCNETDYEYISNNPFLESEKRNDMPVNCTISIISPDQTFQSTGTASIFGYGSRFYKKVSWTMKLDKKFLGRKTIKLRAMANDPTLIREKLTTELFKAVSVPVQEGTYARLIINNDVYGLYTLMDSINKRWMKNYIHGDSKAQIGFSYKLFSTPPEGPYSDLKYLGDDYALYNSGNTYKVDEYEETTIPEGDEAAKWKALIDFVKAYDNWVKVYGEDQSDKSVDELKKFLNIESILRLLAIETLTLSLDGFWYVMSNSAIYKNPERKNYQILPFDFDQTLDPRDSHKLDKETYIEDCITWATRNQSELDNYFTNNLLKHPKIKNRYDIILGKISRETFDVEKVSSFIHAIADLIREDIPWNFEAIDKLDTDYDGLVNHFTLDEFNKNLDYGHVEYDPERNTNDVTFGIKEWVEKRGNSCRAYTANIDLTNDTLISDDYDVSGSQHTFTTNFILFS